MVCKHRGIHSSWGPSRVLFTMALRTTTTTTTTTTTKPGADWSKMNGPFYCIFHAVFGR